MALRRGSRAILRSPAKASCDRRGRELTRTPGSRRSSASCMVAAPISRVSSVPRRLRMRSVKTWPRSKLAASWISSMATKGKVEVARHRLDGGNPIERMFRLDLLLARDQGDGFRLRPWRRRGYRPRAPAGAAAGRSCPPCGSACARWRNGSCRYWSGRARPIRPSRIPATCACPRIGSGEKARSLRSWPPDSRRD